MHCRTSSNSHAHCSSTTVHKVYTQLARMYGSMLLESGGALCPSRIPERQQMPVSFQPGERLHMHLFCATLHL